MPMLPRFQVTVPFANVPPAVAETNEAPDGRTSVREAPIATLIPVLV